MYFSEIFEGILACIVTPDKTISCLITTQSEVARHDEDTK